MSVISLKEVLFENEKFRVDSGYFEREPVRIERLIKGLSCGYLTLGELTSCFRKGIFDIKAESYTTSGVPFVRISNLRNGLIDDSDIAYISNDSNEQEYKTSLSYGDLILSKTAYAAASFVNLPKCNVSQDTVAVKISPNWKKKLLSTYLVAFLNTRHGLTLLNRQFQGNVQMHLSLPDGEKIPVPLLSEKLQTEIDKSFINAFQLSQVSKDIYAQAEQTLLAELGLLDWRPPEPLTYQRKASEVLRAGRFDSEYFQPKYDALHSLLERRGGVRLGDHVLEPIRRGISPEYVEEGGDIIVINSKHVGKVQVEVEDNRYTTRELLRNQTEGRGEVRVGDVLLNSTGYMTIGRCQCLLEEVDAVVDNHVAIIRPRLSLDPVYLACFLNNLVGQMQSERGWTGSSGQIELRPDVIADYRIWDAPPLIQQQIRSMVEQSHTARHNAKHLLERAKRAVEIAIEESEAAALEYLTIPLPAHVVTLDG